MAPYRTMETDARAEAPRDPGIVGDVIAQFADPLAFYRELVQNAIDAGTPTVEARISYAAPHLKVQIRDRGEGMTRDIVENQLLVLFRSTKESDDSKIGKFGIGFASVLAPKPDVVVVQTSRDGRRLTLHLNPDLTFQLYDAGPATQTGTVVELDLAMPVEEAPDFVQRSRLALEKWCRHATVPIEFTADLPGLAAPIAVRIDRPLALDGALVEVRGQSGDGKLVAVVGLVPDGAPYVGFFNHGLTLYETSSPLVGRLAVKIQDARLGHTISRDNVRRDASFDRAIAHAQSLANRELRDAVVRALQTSADGTDRAAHAALVTAVRASEIELDRQAFRFPLLHPVGDQRSLEPKWLGPNWYAVTRTAHTEALAALGVPVLDGSSGLGDAIRSAVSCQLVNVHAELTSVTPVVPSPADEVLLALVGDLLYAAHRAPSKISLAQLAGAHELSLAITGGPDDAVAERGPDQPWVLERKHAERSPFGRLRMPPLVLRTDHPMMIAARALEHPAVAAAHLARALLLQYRALDGERSATLLEHTLSRLGVAGA